MGLGLHEYMAPEKTIIVHNIPGLIPGQATGTHTQTVVSHMCHISAENSRKFTEDMGRPSIVTASRELCEL